MKSESCEWVITDRIHLTADLISGFDDRITYVKKYTCIEYVPDDTSVSNVVNSIIDIKDSNDIIVPEPITLTAPYLPPNPIIIFFLVCVVYMMFKMGYRNLATTRNKYCVDTTSEVTVSSVEILESVPKSIELEENSTTIPLETLPGIKEVLIAELKDRLSLSQDTEVNKLEPVPTSSSVILLSDETEFVTIPTVVKSSSNTVKMDPFYQYTIQFEPLYFTPELEVITLLPDIVKDEKSKEISVDTIMENISRDKVPSYESVSDMVNLTTIKEGERINDAMSSFDTIPEFIHIPAIQSTTENQNAHIKSSLNYTIFDTVYTPNKLTLTSPNIETTHTKLDIPKQSKSRPSSMKFTKSLIQKVLQPLKIMKLRPNLSSSTSAVIDLSVHDNTSQKSTGSTTSTTSSSIRRFSFSGFTQKESMQDKTARLSINDENIDYNRIYGNGNSTHLQ